MDIYIEKLQQQDFDKLYRFESENRAFFERMVPGRGDEYFQYETFLGLQKTLLEEQAFGSSHFYLVKNDLGEIVGRINAVDLNHIGRSAQIGYRVGEAFCGKGVANRALQLLIKELPVLNIGKLYAKTTITNIASQKVLENNGFKKVVSEEAPLELNGEMVRFVHYEWR